MQFIGGGSYATYLRISNSITSVAITIGLFYSALLMKNRNINWVNSLAEKTFAVYLFHEHTLFRPILWIHIFKIASYQGSLYLFLVLVIDTIIIFCCAGILFSMERFIDKKISFRIINILQNSEFVRILKDI